MYKQFTKIDFLKRYGFPEDYLVESVLVYGGWKDKYYTYLKEAIDKLGIKYGVKFIDYPFLKTILEISIDNKKHWFILAYGGAMLSEHLHIACLFGSKKNILFGSCGGLNKDASSRGIVLPNEVFAEESSAKLYSENKSSSHFPDLKLLENLKSKVQKNHNVFVGKTITCQAMLGETWEDVVAWSDSGFIAVEMEAATVYAVSKHFNVPSAALLIIGDNLIKEETIYDQSYIDGQDLRKKVQDDMFEIVVKEFLN